MPVVLLALACGGSGPTVAGTPAFEAPVVAPWSGWSLPLEGGRVVTCTAGLLTVHYGADRVADLAAAWRPALAQAGWTEMLDHSEGGLVAVRFGHGPTQQLDLAVVPYAGETIVSAALVPEWTEQASR
jgi:hypothetical protein